MASINQIHRSLSKLKQKAPQRTIDVSTEKWVIFSDHHRGIGDGADDFAPCKESYSLALKSYLEEDFGLILLGDVEEFWENTLSSVISKYRDVLNLEKEFHAKAKLVKIWGNHDDAWNHLSQVKKHLFPFFDNIRTYEALSCRAVINERTLGDILLVHGHQGSSASDKFAGISRWFVRVIWRNVQRLFNIPLSTPSVSKELKDKHDIAMHTWASSEEKQILICGHTHQPVFMSRNHLDILESELKSLNPKNENDAKRIVAINEKIAQLHSKTTAIGTLVSDQTPSYFNSGCCSFADGDITGLEIIEGDIKLVKWDKSKKTIIQSEKLEQLFEML
ncbi:MAG: metallophosphoesterase [Bacteroidia bacterium]